MPWYADATHCKKPFDGIRSISAVHIPIKLRDNKRSSNGLGHRLASLPCTENTELVVQIVQLHLPFRELVNV